jgi:hypothetical protein
MTDDLQSLEDELGSQLRHTLHTVADSLDAAETPAPARRRWRRTTAFGAAAALAVGSAAAFAAQNDVAIVRLPVEQALLSGEASSGEWWLFPMEAVADGCDGRHDGVVLVAEEINKAGQELNAGGVVYGEPSSSNLGCAPYDKESWLGDPARVDFGHSRLGFESEHTPWGVYGTVHPTITSVRVSVDGAAPTTVETVAREDWPDGPRYVAFVVPADATTARIDLVDASGEVMPTGSDGAGIVRQFR